MRLTTYLSRLQLHGQAVIHHGLEVLIVFGCVLLLALGMDFLDGFLARELAHDGYMAGIDDQVLALRRGNTITIIVSFRLVHSGDCGHTLLEQ